jgi:hypothetical protein
MKCRNCGTEIAEKALICYRCGTATSEPRIAPPPPPAQRGVLPMLVAILLIAVAAVLGLPRVLAGEALVGGWVAAAIAAMIMAWVLRPRGRRKRR